VIYADGAGQHLTEDALAASQDFLAQQRQFAENAAQAEEWMKDLPTGGKVRRDPLLDFIGNDEVARLHRPSQQQLDAATLRSVRDMVRYPRFS
jgi:hypothetical protein